MWVGQVPHNKPPHTHKCHSSSVQQQRQRRQHNPEVSRRLLLRLPTTRPLQPALTWLRNGRPQQQRQWECQSWRCLRKRVARQPRDSSSLQRMLPALRLPLAAAALPALQVAVVVAAAAAQRIKRGTWEVTPALSWP
jgi:hypothetical protein